MSAAALVALFALSLQAEAKRPVFVNYDDTHFLHSRDKLGLRVDEAEILSMVRQYEGTHVSDLVLCIGGRIADVPNKAKESWLDKYRQTRENGLDVCYTNAYGPRLAHEMHEVLKIDPYALWIDESRKVGIRPWLSFRLNDCHGNGEKAGVLHPNFIHDHPEYRRIRHREPMGYFDRCLDFEIEAVRARELAFVGEMLERYDVEGVELDWQREIYCFQPGRENRETVNGFMRAVRELTSTAAKRRGHPVRMMARVPADPDTALRFGFDVAAWADDKLVDVLVPCPRWDVTDNELPVDLWKRLLRGSDVVLAPGMELRMRNADGKAFYVTMPQLVGAASAFYSQGAEAVYLYNYFDDPDWKAHPDDAHRCYWTAFGSPSDPKAVCWKYQLEWLKLIGSPEKVFAAPRDHMLTFRDIVPLWGGVVPPLPAEIPAGGQRYLRLVTGRVPANAKLTLRLGVTGGKAPQRVFVNSRPCTYRENAVCMPPFTMEPLCCYDVAPYPEENALVEIVADKAVRLTHLDLQIRKDGAGEPVRKCVFGPGQQTVHIREICRFAGKAHPKTLVFETAEGDAESEINARVGSFAAAGAVVEPIRMHKAKINPVEVKRKILEADIVWFGCGVYEWLLNKIDFYYLEDTIKSAYRNGTVLCGNSAGSLLQAYGGYNDFSDGRYDFARGLGIIRAYFVPHFQSEQFSKGFEERLARETDPATPDEAWAVENGAGVFFVNEKPEVRRIHGKGESPQAKAFHFTRRNGKWLKTEVSPR